MVMSAGFVDPNDIELDLDKDQPIKAKKIEGAWGLYEELAKAKEENGTTQPVVDFDIAREAGTDGVSYIGGSLHSFDADGERLPGDDWFSMAGGSGSAGATSTVDGGVSQDEVVFGDEAFTQATGNDFGQLNRAANRLLDQLEVGETGTIAFKPNQLNLENNQYVSGSDLTDKNGDLANGIPIAEVTKIDEQLKRVDDQEVRFSTSWQGTGTSELVLDSTPVNGADFAQKLNALISTDDNLGPFSWSSINLSPTEETRENGIHSSINLDLKDIDNPEGSGRWSPNQQIGASNQPNDESEAYTYEYSSTGSWNFKDIYSNLKEGESGTWELDRIHINTGNQWSDVNANSERLNSPLKVTLLETNPNPTSSSLDLEGLSFEIDSEIAIQDIFDEKGELDKSFIDSLINSDQQSVDFWSNYNANIDGQNFHFHSMVRETEWNGKQLQEDFSLPWNTLDFMNAAIDSGVEEIELTRDYQSMSVNSDSVNESYHASVDRNGNINKGHRLPNDYEGDPIEPADPSSMLNAPETITLTMGDLQGLAEKFSTDASRPDVLRFGDYELSNQLLSLDNVLVDTLSGDAVEQIAVLGSQAARAGDYRIDITAESLSKVHNLEAVEVTIQLDPMLFDSINLSDVQISSQLPIHNSIQIDNETGTVTLSGASLANLGQGTKINGDQALASIDLNFDNDYLKTIAYNDVTGELELSPISFQMSVGKEDAVFSRDFTDSTGQLNRDIQSLAELNGEVALNSDRVSLIKEIVRMEEQSGLTLGTQRTVGVKGEFTNLVREGSTLEASTQWRNTGNTTVDGLEVQAIENENARLVNSQFSANKQSLDGGHFENGEWVAEAAESTKITAEIEVTGKAGNVLDLSDGILGISTETSEEVFENEKGSQNLITYQGDLNYDGRVSFKDLAYLNAGAARQEIVEKVDSDGSQIINEFGTVEKVATDESYASDVDANYDGKVSIADLSVLEKDWGKSLHTGDESFLGGGEKLTWESIDGDGTWDNSSFKRENTVASEQIAEAQAASVVMETVDEGAGGGLSDGPSELQKDDVLLGAETY